MPVHQRFGLALSGGGFRASFFHLGVLRRLAELDLLRHITDMSTVSGGSILAAHYYLHFKRAFEAARGSLTRDDYIRIVDDVAEEFIRGNAKDLRNLLLMNPMTHLQALVFGRGYGRPMASLYTKHFYRRITAAIFHGSRLSGATDYEKNGIPLHQAITLRPDQTAAARLPNKSSGYPDSTDPELALADFNREEAFATIPRLVLNATCLNTGGAFQFMLNEVGGSDIGYVRYDELFMLLQYKVLISSTHPNFEADYFNQVCEAAITYGEYIERKYDGMPTTAFKRGGGFPAHTPEHLAFYLAGRRILKSGEIVPDPWLSDRHQRNEVLRWLSTANGFAIARRLFECTYGELRRAKICAWYLLDNRGWVSDSEPRAGWMKEEYQKEFWRAVKAISPELAERFAFDTDAFEPLAFLILDLAYLRNADAIHWEASGALDDLTLSDAVAASANFPPVFTPFRIFNLFDQDKYETLSLTDGGVHDNQGIEALLSAGCEYMIVSDAGGVVRPEQSPPDARVPMMDRVIDLLMGGVRAAMLSNMKQTLNIAAVIEEASDETKHRLDEERLEAFALRHATIFHMTSPVIAKKRGSLRNFAQAEVAELRTDLDAFSDLEIAALRHQGYQLADRHLDWYANESPFKPATVLPPRRPDSRLPDRPSRRDRVLLCAGSKLSGRLSAAYPFRSALAALLFAILFALVSHPTVADLRWVYEQDLSNYLDVHHVTPREKLDRTLQRNTDLGGLDGARHRLSEMFGRLNLLAIPFLTWTIYLLLRQARRKYRDSRKQSITTVETEIIKDRLVWIASLLLRPWNMISAVGLIGFILTLRVRWLVLFLPLYSVIAALFFAVVHFVFTRMWLNAGRLPPDREAAANTTTVAVGQ
jgi:predicted acylesterase/phospholipase RssA